MMVSLTFSRCQRNNLLQGSRGKSEYESEHFIRHLWWEHRKALQKKEQRQAGKKISDGHWDSKVLWSSQLASVTCSCALMTERNSAPMTKHFSVLYQTGNILLLVEIHIKPRILCFLKMFEMANETLRAAGLRDWRVLQLHLFPEKLKIKRPTVLRFQALDLQRVCF